MLREHSLKTKKERKHIEMRKNRQGHYCLRRLEHWYFHPGLRVAETCVWQQVRTVKQIMLHYPGCLLWLRCLALVTGMFYSLTLAREWCAGGGQPQLQWPWGEQGFQLLKKQRAKPRGQRLWACWSREVRAGTLKELSAILMQLLFVDSGRSWWLGEVPRKWQVDVSHPILGRWVWFQF